MGSPLDDAGIDLAANTASITPPSGKPVDGNNPLLASAGTIDADAALDAGTIANAVTAVQSNGQPIAWSNPATGSSGMVHGVREYRSQAGMLCRDFTALRTSYDGVRNYSGTVCLTDRGSWDFSRFEAV